MTPSKEHGYETKTKSLNSESCNDHFDHFHMTPSKEHGYVNSESSNNHV